MAIIENKQKHWPQHLVKLKSNLVKVYHASGEDRSTNVETISTGSLSLDVALVLVVYHVVVLLKSGPESSGKTLNSRLSLQLNVKAKFAFIDAEHALDLMLKKAGRRY